MANDDQDTDADREGDPVELLAWVERLQRENAAAQPRSEQSRAVRAELAYWLDVMRDKLLRAAMRVN